MTNSVTADVSKRRYVLRDTPGGVVSVRFCACGCGEQLHSKWYNTRFRPGHHSRTKTPRSYRHGGNDGSYVHRVRAERALGRPLPEGVQIHHAGTIHDNDRLVICQDDAYHKFLHVRTRIVRAGGDPNTEKICGRCRQVKSRTEFHRAKGRYDGLYGFCASCANARRR